MVKSKFVVAVPLWPEVVSCGLLGLLFDSLDRLVNLSRCLRCFLVGHLFFLWHVFVWHVCSREEFVVERVVFVGVLIVRVRAAVIVLGA